MKPDRVGNGANSRLCLVCCSAVYEETHETDRSEGPLLCIGRVRQRAVLSSANGGAEYREGVYTY